LALPTGDVVLARATASAVSADEGWLSPGEAEVQARLRVSKRAADWRLGRWVAKEAVALALGAPDLPRAAVEILAGPGGCPRVRILSPGTWPPVSVSISHAADTGFAAAAAEAVRLGCDVEEIALRSEEFVSDYFTAEEAAWIRVGGRERHVRANLLWSAKESALKALGEGLRKDTRSVAVEVGEIESAAGDAWRSLKVVSAGGDEFAGRWRVADGFVWTVVR
jgi:4'-phosphopantetheinyl transferase